MLRALFYGLSAVALAVAGAWLGLWLYAHLVFGLTLTDQPGLVLFPRTTIASAETAKTVAIQLNGMIDAQVPFKQTLNLPLKGHYAANIKFDTVVPVEFTIQYRGAIPVDSMAQIHGVTDFNYQKVKRLRNVSFTAQIPLRFEQPVVLTVPVKANLHLIYNGPIGVDFNQDLQAPVDTVLRTRLKAVRVVNAPILSRFGMNVHWPATPVPVIIKHADLRLQIDALKLEKKIEPPPAVQPDK